MQRKFQLKCEGHTAFTAVILAAGQGKRAGRPKWQLIYEGKKFLEIVVAKLKSCGINNIICVVRTEDEAAIAELFVERGVKLVLNPIPELGMITSLYYGVRSNVRQPSPRELEGGSQKELENTGYLVFPVDHPFVSENTIDKLRTVFLVQHAAQKMQDQDVQEMHNAQNSQNVRSQQDVQDLNAIICPRCRGISGHPLIIPHKIVANLTPDFFAHNLREFLRAQRCQVIKVDVEDEGVLKNINFYEDLAEKNI